jgi:hypothetical protein
MREQQAQLSFGCSVRITLKARNVFEHFGDVFTELAKHAAQARPKVGRFGKGGQRVIVIPAYPAVTLLDAIGHSKSSSSVEVSGISQHAGIDPVSEDLCTSES